MEGRYSHELLYYYLFYPPPLNKFINTPLSDVVNFSTNYHTAPMLWNVLTHCTFQQSHLNKIMFRKVRRSDTPHVAWYNNEDVVVRIRVKSAQWFFWYLTSTTCTRNYLSDLSHHGHKLTNRFHQSSTCRCFFFFFLLTSIETLLLCFIVSSCPWFHVGGIYNYSDGSKPGLGGRGAAPIPIV